MEEIRQVGGGVYALSEGQEREDNKFPPADPLTSVYSPETRDTDN